MWNILIFVCEIKNLWTRADGSYPGRRTDAPLESRTIEEAEDELEQEKDWMMRSLEKAHRQHPLAPLEFNCLDKPKFSTLDHERRWVYFHEYCYVKEAEFTDLNYISPGHRAEWVQEWENKTQWILSTKHLNRPISFGLPFCDKNSPDFRCWWNTDTRDVSQKCWISIESQRQYMKTSTANWKLGAELRNRCQSYYEIDEVKDNNAKFITEYDNYEKLKNDSRYAEHVQEEHDAAEATRLQEEANVERQHQTKVGVSRYSPIVLAVMCDPENHVKEWSLSEINEGKRTTYKDEHVWHLRQLIGFLKEKGPGGASSQQVQNMLGWSADYIKDNGNLAYWCRIYDQLLDYDSRANTMTLMPTVIEILKHHDTARQLRAANPPAPAPRIQVRKVSREGPWKFKVPNRKRKTGDNQDKSSKAHKKTRCDYFDAFSCDKGEDCPWFHTGADDTEINPALPKVASPLFIFSSRAL